MILAVMIRPGCVFDEERAEFSRTGSMVPGRMDAVPVVLSCACAPGKVSSPVSIAVVTIKPETTLTRQKFLGFTIFPLIVFSPLSGDSAYLMKSVPKDRLGLWNDTPEALQHGCQSC